MTKGTALLCMERRFMKTYELKKGNVTYHIQLQVCTYPNDNLAIQMLACEEGCFEPWDVLTVNFDEKLAKNCAFIDTNNQGEDIVIWIIRNGLGVPTGRIAESGFCKYPEYRFRTAALEEMDPDGYVDYLENRRMEE